MEEENTLKESIIKDSTIKIQSATIASVFENRYKYCLTSKECYNSVEYIKPDLVNTYPKTLLKINGNITLGEKSRMQEVFNLYDLIELVGKVKYTIGEETKTQKLPFRKVTPTKKTENDAYYIELQKEIEQAEKIELIFALRNINYHYHIK